MDWIDVQQSNETLIQKIKAFADAELHARQVARRTKELLPEKIGQLTKALDSFERGGARLRQILTNPEMLDFLEKYLELSQQARHFRIQYETHLMLYEARRSLRIASNSAKAALKKSKRPS